MNSLPQEPVCQPPPSYLVGPLISDARAYFGVCPHAQTLVAFSLVYNTTVLFALPCRRWSCRVCSRTKIRRLACAVRTAKPNRLLTLTVDPSLSECPRDAWEATRKKVPLLVRRLRNQFGEVEYLRVTEVTKAGWPHYHLLVRSGFLPHAVVKSLWREMTGARIVDLRQVTKSFHAYQYLVKYLSKLHKLEWTERHVSVSRNFIPPNDWVAEDRLEYGNPEFHRFHPSNFVCERYEGRTLKRLSDCCHLVLPLGADPNAYTPRETDPVRTDEAGT